LTKFSVTGVREFTAGPVGTGAEAPGAAPCWAHSGGGTSSAAATAQETGRARKKDGRRRGAQEGHFVMLIRS
jgi:hypothetical protein